MIEKLKLVHHNLDKKNPVSLHPYIINILFEHRRHIKNIFLQIKGHYEIAYFGINMINAANELVTFSSLPHMEYNLIQQGLWHADPCFTAKDLSKNILYWWDEVNADPLFSEPIQWIRLKSNHFNLGMTVLREIKGFHFLYSYATYAKRQDLKQYYNEQIYNLLDIGDYFCNAALNLYVDYKEQAHSPQLHHNNTKAAEQDIRSTFKVIVNHLYS